MALSERTAKEPGSIGDTATRLISWSRGESWGLARVEYVSEFARKRVLSSLRYALAEAFIPLHEIQLPSYQPASGIVQFLVEQLTNLESGVVSVSGFATAFQRETRLEDSLRVLNFNRENIIPPTHRQIWWLPSSFAETFVPAVPDLDSWFTTRLYLTEGGPSPSPAPPEDDYYRLNQLSNIPERNPSFTGRESVLDSIHKELIRGGSVVIQGLGGIGKTQTAFEYAHRKRDDYKTILWTRADNEDSLTRGFFRIAVLLDLPEVQEDDQTLAANAARHWLQFNDDWLLILDELKDTSLLSSLWGNGKGHILATSRVRMHQSSPSIALPPMTPVESRALLFNRSVRQPKDVKDAEAADEIAQELGHHPLTLDLAGAYIGRTKISYVKYLLLYRDLSRAVHATAKESPRAFGAVELTLRRLKQPAQNLLKLCSFLDPAEIPLELVVWSREMLHVEENSFPDSRREAEELILLSDRYSLMHANAFSRICSMHPIIQAAIRNRMDQVEQRRWAEAAVRIVSKLFAYPDDNWTRQERLLPTALAAAELIENWDFASRDATTLLAGLGLYLRNRAQHTRAEPFLRRALKLTSAIDEPYAPITIEVLEGLADLYYHEGRYEESKELLSRALALQESMVGANLSTAKTMRTLARIELRLQNHERAQFLLLKALEILRESAEQNPEERIKTIQYLGAAYIEQGRFSEAESLFRSALDLAAESGLQPDNPSITYALSGLARSYLGEHKYNEAKPLYQRLLALTSAKNQTREHAQALVNLALIYIAEESYSTAETLLREALDIEMKLRNRLQAAKILNYLASISFREQRYQDAEKYFREALDIQEDLLGPGHPSVVRSWDDYSMILRQLGREEEARDVERKTARIKAQRPSPKRTL